jgi:hypothetical protein
MPPHDSTPSNQERAFFVTQYPHSQPSSLSSKFKGNKTWRLIASLVFAYCTAVNVKELLHVTLSRTSRLWFTILLRFNA